MVSREVTFLFISWAKIEYIFDSAKCRFSGKKHADKPNSLPSTMQNEENDNRKCKSINHPVYMVFSGF